MKKSILLLALLLYITSIQAQVTVTTTALEPNVIYSYYFLPSEVHLENDSIINGYASYYRTGLSSIRFIKEKPKTTLVNEWKNYPAREIKKISVTYSDKIKTRYSIKMKACLPRILATKEYENDAVILYGIPSEIYCSFSYGKYAILKKGETKAKRVTLNIGDDNPYLSKKILKAFKKCKVLKKKINDKEFKNSYDELIRLLDFYQTSACSK